MLTTTRVTGLEPPSLDELEAELAAPASHLDAGTCRWLELVGELDRRGGWTAWGQGSCAERLAWRCGLAPRAAREPVRIARRLPELPLVHAAFTRGELSYAKVRALARVATAESEEELLELARVCAAAQLERAVRALRFRGTAAGTTGVERGGARRARRGRPRRRGREPSGRRARSRPRRGARSEPETAGSESTRGRARPATVRR